ncbi:MAG: hypothetical protein MUF58_06350 [Arcicella sp.]|jgi:hypothetical protein|nr:hypothetical protein [Arcicella sp.]
MITPHKYLNLDLSVINVSALVVDKLKKHNLLKYDELLNMVINALGKNAKEVFPYSLNFLFLLDKLHYLPELDVFQLNFE